jgi:HD-like signal output (HDOD) protein
MSAEIILDKIESLPALSENVNYILDICDNPGSSLTELAEAIRKDPLISANILKAANAPEYGYKEEIRDINKAVTLFGMVSIKGFVMSSFIQGLEEVDLSPYNLNSETFIKLIQQQNAFVLSWYKKDPTLLSELSLASQLMEVGKIILSKIVIETSSQKLFAYHIHQIEKLPDLVKMEKEIFDLSHEEVSSELIKKWGFSQDIYIPLRYLSTPHLAPEKYRKTTYILHVVKTLINAHQFNKKANVARAIAIVKKYRLRPESFVTTYKRHFQLSQAVPA